MKNLLHTPDGVRDIYGKDFAEKMELENKIRDIVKSYGYEDIQPPTFEFFDVFSKECGTVPSKDLYKFFDNEGNTLVLRPDYTPSVARCAAKYFYDEKDPVRLCYKGNTYTNLSKLQGKLREVTEMGAELIGDDSVCADAEVIAMVIDALKAAGLTDFRITIGNSGFFKGLCEEAGLDEETELTLRSFISGKNYFATENLLAQTNVDDKYRESILKIADMFNDMNSLQECKDMVNNERSRRAIERLEAVYKYLDHYGVCDYVSFDLGMLSKYNYYTGIVFKAYTFGIGTALVKGGRYDGLLSQFGFNAPAIGFAIVIDDLLEALNHQKVKISVPEDAVKIYYDPFDEEDFKKNLAMSQKLRKEGKKTA
ncbi:MAG: ATP phosphoribosyltransferase regulatory subunit, partial [Lachnospiraceae bacterium]|nr:ATP phosphoribosyltransferase regulatory subunit [Lachnospiraceae bacterium]